MKMALTPATLWLLRTCMSLIECFCFCFFFPFLMNILIWNCQGAVSHVFRRTLKQHLRDYNPSIACLLEPKVSGTQANDICFSLDFNEWLRVEAFGFSGELRYYGRSLFR